MLNKYIYQNCFVQKKLTIYLDKQRKTRRIIAYQYFFYRDLDKKAWLNQRLTKGLFIHEIFLSLPINTIV